jgi:long-subunit acyl-CoA synthetase (AMP-forming)
MYPGEHFMTRSDQPALIMSGTGETMSCAAYKARTNRLAYLLRAKGLNREDHYAIFMQNNVETCGASERAGLHYTCVNSFPTADELAKAKGHAAAAQAAEAAEAKCDMVIDRRHGLLRRVQSEAQGHNRRDRRSRSLFSAHRIRLSVKPWEGAFPMFLPGNMSMSPLRMR